MAVNKTDFLSTFKFFFGTGLNKEQQVRSSEEMFHIHLSVASSVTDCKMNEFTLSTAV